MRRFHIPENVKHRYQIMSPSTHNRSFRMARVENGKMPTVKDERIDAINSRYLAGDISKKQAFEQMELLREALYRADGVKVSRVESNSENEKLVDRYIKAVIQPRKTKQTSKESAAQALFRGVRALGEHSLLTADISTLQAAIDAAYPDQRQRQLVVSLNSLLRWAGRTDKLQPHSKEAKDVHYIPLEKIDAVLPHLPSEAWRVCVQLAIYSGLRMGELFALEVKNLDRKESTIHVQWQIDISGKKVLPKRGKVRIASIFPDAVRLYYKWLDLKEEITVKERKRASRILRTACRKAFPKRSEWHLRFHDLRHSYAIALLERGVDIQAIAYSLGDGVQVAQQYYLGTMQPLGMSRSIKALLDPKKAG